MSGGSLAFIPLLPWIWLGALAGAMSIVAAIALWRRRPGAVWQVLLLAWLCVILAGPNYVAATLRPLPDIALIVTDHSQSMAVGDRLALEDRALAALQASAAGTQLRYLDIPAAGDGGTMLFAALRGALATIPAPQLAGIVAITDGDIADAPARLDLPFVTLLTAKGEQTDRELRLLGAPSYGLVGQTASFKFVVLDHGAQDSGTPASVTITADGKRVARKTAIVGQPVSVGLPVSHAGAIVVQAAVAPLPGEVSPLNDQIAFNLNGIHKRLNVLLISGSPNQGERSWRLLLKSDPAVALVHFTILRTPDETIDADVKDLALVPFPIHQLFQSDIGKFDLIIMDRFEAGGLLPASYLENIADYVRRGGALLAAFGPEFGAADSLAASPLGAVLPVGPAAPGTLTQIFTPAITPLGRRHPVTAPFATMALPPWYRMEAASAPQGDVLMTGGGAPLLILSSAGQGRVGTLLSDQFWLWTRGGVHDGPALTLLRRIVHWLLREPALEAESLTAGIDHGVLTINRQTIGASSPGAAAVTAPDGQRSVLPLRRTAPGTYAASLNLGGAQPGVWKVGEGGFTAFAAAAMNNPLEYQNLAATAAAVGPLSRRVVWLGKTPAPPLPSLLIPRFATAATGAKDIPLLPPLPCMALALALLAAGWWREGR